jgi:hypothetical protein
MQVGLMDVKWSHSRSFETDISHSTAGELLIPDTDQL